MDLGIGVLDVTLAQRSRQITDIIRTRVLFLWNRSLWDLNAFVHSLVILRHAERFRDGACAGAAGCLGSPDPQSELGFLGLPGSGYRGCRWRLGCAWLGN